MTDAERTEIYEQLRKENPIPDDYMKTCSKCGETKLASKNFTRKACVRDGFQPQCKECDKKRHDSNRDRNIALRAERKSSFMDATVDELLSIIDYDEKTGILYGKNTHIPLKNSVDKKTGYISVRVPKYTHSLRAHRLIWFLTHGEWAESVDHINGNTSDNRLNNLRECTHRENSHNQYFHREGKLAHAVYNAKCTQHPWESLVCGDENIRLGRFTTEREASLEGYKYLYQHKLLRREFIPDCFSDEELNSKINKEL